MQLQFQRRLSSGFQALASYTWSHSLDNVSSDSSLEGPVTIVDPRQERGPSNFDVRYAFNAAATYDIPLRLKNAFANALLHNFSVDTTFAARSATPVNVVTGVNTVGGFGVSRPDLIPGIPLYLNDSTVGGGRRINRAAFIAPVGRQGNLGRNALRGFPMWQLDLALRRQFKLLEALDLQFRAEFFNILNHPNFGDPGSASLSTNALNNALFGQSTVVLGRSLASGGNGFNPLYQVGGPRSIQFALKLAF
jgi:hypothetical protein